MKKNLNRSLISTAVALTLSAAAAYGQSNQAIAKIPFEFRTAAGAHAAGTYEVGSIAGNHATLRVRERFGRCQRST